MVNLIDPVVSQPHLDLDLVQWATAYVLNSDDSPVFANGIQDVSQAAPDLIYLYPYYLEDKPDNCATVRSTDIWVNNYNPTRRARVQFGIRMPLLKTTEATPSIAWSAQKRATAAAEAMLQVLRSNGSAGSGVAVTYKTLPSGRNVLAFTKARISKQGEDRSKRFTSTVEFEMLYVDIVPVA